MVPIINPETGVAFLVLENRDPHDVQLLAIDDNGRKMAESNPSECGGALVKRKRPRPGLDRRQTVPHFSLEPIGQVPAAFRGIIIDRRVEVVLNGRMKLQRHPRGRRTPAQNCSSLTGCTRPLSSSASRRSASAIISSGSWAAGGRVRLPKSVSARCSRRSPADGGLQLQFLAECSWIEKNTARETAGKVRHDFAAAPASCPLRSGQEKCSRYRQHSTSSAVISAPDVLVEIAAAPPASAEQLNRNPG